MSDTLLISMISVICGAGTWNEMELYAREKEEFSRAFLNLPNGIPPHDTFNRVFSAMDSKQFEACFIEWVQTLRQHFPKEVMAIDGKTIRRAKSKGKRPLMASAFASANNLVLGQVKTSEEPNEITAIPKLLELLSLGDTIVTIDAMGCQKEISDKIIDTGADYILAVKENQSALPENILDEFGSGKNMQAHLSEDVGHGRIETGKCSTISSFQFIQVNNHWGNLTTIARIESARELKDSNKPVGQATPYHIASFKAAPEEFQKAMRSHWAIQH